MRALVAIAEHPEDPFSIIVCQTLAEIRTSQSDYAIKAPLTKSIVLIDVDLLERSGGMRVLLQALVDGPAELAPIMTSAFLHIVDIPRSRVYLNPGTDLEVHVFINVL